MCVDCVFSVGYIVAIYICCVYSIHVNKDGKACTFEGSVADPDDCSLYYHCTDAALYHYSCGSQAAFDPALQTCISPPSDVLCIQQMKGKADKPGRDDVENENTFICKENGYFPDPTDCTRFYRCSKHSKHAFSCPIGLGFDSGKITCDPIENVANCASSLRKETVHGSNHITGKTGPVGSAGKELVSNDDTSNNQPNKGSNDPNMVFSTDPSIENFYKFADYDYTNVLTDFDDYLSVDKQQDQNYYHTNHYQPAPDKHSQNNVYTSVKNNKALPSNNNNKVLHSNTGHNDAHFVHSVAMENSVPDVVIDFTHRDQGTILQNSYPPTVSENNYRDNNLNYQLENDRNNKNQIINKLANSYLSAAIGSNTHIDAKQGTVGEHRDGEYGAQNPWNTYQQAVPDQHSRSQQHEKWRSPADIHLDQIRQQHKELERSAAAGAYKPQSQQRQQYTNTRMAYNAGNNANKPPKQQVQQQYKGFFNSIPSAADMGDASRYRQLYQPPRERVITPNLVPYNNRGSFQCPHDGYFRDHADCSRFFHCTHGLPYLVRCNGGLYFNPANKICDWPARVPGCTDGMRKVFVSSSKIRLNDQANTGTKKHMENDIQPKKTKQKSGRTKKEPKTKPIKYKKDVHSDPVMDDIPIIVHNDCDKAGYVRHPYNCSIFYRCGESSKIQYVCERGLAFHTGIRACVIQQLVDGCQVGTRNSKHKKRKPNT